MALSPRLIHLVRPRNTKEAMKILEKNKMQLGDLHTYEMLLVSQVTIQSVNIANNHTLPCK